MNYDVFYLSFILFSLSLLIFFTSNNLIITLISIELILNSLNIAIAGLARISWTNEPYIWVIFIFAITAAEAGIGLSIIILLARKIKTLNLDFSSYIKEKYR